VDNPNPIVCGACGHKCYDTEWVAELTLKFGTVRESYYEHPPPRRLRGYIVDWETQYAPLDVQDNYFEIMLCSRCRDRIWDAVDVYRPEPAPAPIAEPGIRLWH